MEEKIIIKSKSYNILGLCLIPLSVGILLFLFFGLPAALDISHSYSGELRMGYFLTSAVPFYAAIYILPLAIIAGLFYWIFSRISLTVTDKRVYGTAIFGQRVDLPLDMISAVKTISLLRGIAVATASGAIRFCFVTNAAEIHTAISKLLLERQAKRETVSAAAAAPTATASNADELQKYKALLDSGAITQEEYEAKKKQILGL